METQEEIAFELFNAVHERLEHRYVVIGYFERPCVKQMWIEVARLIDDIVTRCWNLDGDMNSRKTADDATAEEMYKIVHHRLKDGRDITCQAEFGKNPPLRLAWLEIADVVRERARLRRMSFDEAR